MLNPTSSKYRELNKEFNRKKARTIAFGNAPFAGIRIMKLQNLISARIVEQRDN